MTEQQAIEIVQEAGAIFMGIQRSFSALPDGILYQRTAFDSTFCDFIGEQLTVAYVHERLSKKPVCKFTR